MKLKHYYDFEEFRFDPEQMRLWRNDENVRVTPKGLEILYLLVENRSRTVTRGELLETVWKDTFIEEGNINFNISLLRKALRQKGSKDTQFIRTIPKEGYRFVADVREFIEEDAAGQIFETEVVKEGSLESAVLRLRESPDLSASRIRWHFIGIVLLAVFLLSSFGLWLKLSADETFAGSKTPIRSIAVLPLKSLNDETEDRSLSLGFADALITSLGDLNEIRVIATGGVSRYGDLQKQPTEIGKEMGVDGVLDGSFQRVNGKLRVTLRLIHSRDGAQIWSGSFDESESEIFHLQDAMARETARALKLTLRPNEGATRSTGNIDAYIHFLKGDHLLRQRGDDNVKRSEGFFREAVSIDPYYSRAWAGLAAAQSMRTDIETAERTVAHALELDPNLAEAHATRGFMLMFHYWNWPEAESALDRAVELDPNSVDAHHWRGVLYSIHGRIDEAQTEMHRALELDPLSTILLSDIGQLHYFAREYDQAEIYCLKALAIDPAYLWAHRYLSQIYRQQGKMDAAFEQHLITSCAPYPSEETKAKCIANYGNTYRRSGWNGYFRRDVRDNLRVIARNQVSPDGLSPAYWSVVLGQVGLGDKAGAFENLHHALDTKDKFEIMNFTFPYMKVDPQFDALRDDPRFQAVLRRINL